MPVYCQKCGKQHPDDANFCMQCGNSLKSASATVQALPTQWEYKDVVINLMNAKIRVHHFQDQEGKRAIAYMNNLIVEHLQNEGRSGWQAEGPTDFNSVVDRLDCDEQKNWLGDITGFTYKSVRIRLRRLITR